MPNWKDRVALAASQKSAPDKAKKLGPVDANERFAVTVRCRPRQELPSAHALGMKELEERRYLTREDLASAYGADAHDIALVEEFAAEHGLDVGEIGVGRRTITLLGTAAAHQAAFGVQLDQYELNGKRFRGRSGTVFLPVALDGVVTGVFGLDDRPQARPYVRFAHADGTPAPFTPTDLAKLYGFPTNVDGSGQCIAIIELGGGFRASELKTYFSSLGLAKQPKVTAISINGGHNAPGVDKNADGEVMLDIEVAGAVAPGAQIAVYFAPNTDAGFLNAINSALHDSTRRPSVISISWGASEDRWTQQAMQAMDQAFQSAAALGVTILAAAGDDGASDGMSDGKAHVDFPSASPHITACGGTKLLASNHVISSEVVWNELSQQAGSTGGGVSSVFPLPDWQKDAKVPLQKNTGKPGRGVPDVSAVADPMTGYRVLVDGQSGAIGGTSAVAPLYAGLIALINQAKGRRLGFINPLIYAKAHGAFRDITQGNNAGYSAGPGWDACTGWGSPNGVKLLGSL